MMNFPNIPLKVTINEYIEIAKDYSTPKSGKFVNGMLDTLSKQLQKEGKIKKSGRERLADFPAAWTVGCDVFSAAGGTAGI